MIYGIVGKPGSGKTYLAVKMAIDSLKKGVPVFSNLHIYGARYGSSMIEFLKVKKGLIVLDELNVEAGSRNIKYLPPPVYRQWSQHRHRGLNIIWTAQTIQRIDIIMRELTNEVYECHSFMDKLYWYSKYQPEELMTPMGSVVLKKPLISAFAGMGLFSKKVYSLYSSQEEIEIPAELLKRMSREWGEVNRKAINDPLGELKICQDYFKDDISFQDMKKDQERGEIYKKKIKEIYKKL